jgi:hypothetical protein
MKKRSHQKQIDRNSRSSTTGGERHMVARRVFESKIFESVAKASDRVQSLFECGGDVSLDELQGAVEYLLDKVKAARGLNGRVA